MKLFLTSNPCDDHVPEGVQLPFLLDGGAGWWKGCGRAIGRGCGA